MDLVLSLIIACGVVRPPAAGGVVRDPVPTAPAPDTARSGPAEPSAVPAGPVQTGPWPGMAPFAPGAGEAEPQRPRAVEMSESYHVRLVIHQVASFATVPLFIAEYVLGTKLYRDPPGPEGTRQAHRYVALGVAGLFAVNTVTGVWNLWDSRKQPEGRTLRWVHGGMMLAADAGFVAAGMVAPGRRRLLSATPPSASLHRTLALASMGTALASYAIMLVFRH